MNKYILFHNKSFHFTHEDFFFGIAIRAFCIVSDVSTIYFLQTWSGAQAVKMRKVLKSYFSLMAGPLPTTSP